MKLPILVLETSALVALVRLEAEHEAFELCLADANALAIPASAYLEFTLVSKGAKIGRPWLDRFIVGNQITIHPISDITTRLAADAFERYGRGSGHSARLNFGDCLSYATAIELDAPLLFKGLDFAHTDVKRAI